MNRSEATTAGRCNARLEVFAIGQTVLQRRHPFERIEPRTWIAYLLLGGELFGMGRDRRVTRWRA